MPLVFVTRDWVARSPTFSAAAEEATLTRIFAGQHFLFDLTTGQRPITQRNIGSSSLEAGGCRTWAGRAARAPRLHWNRRGFGKRGGLYLAQVVVDVVAGEHFAYLAVPLLAPSVRGSPSLSQKGRS